MYFVDFDRVYDQVPHGALWVVRVVGVLLQAIQSLNNQSERCVLILCKVKNVSNGCWALPRVRSVFGILTQAKEFKYLRILFTSDGKLSVRQTGGVIAVSAVVQALYHTVVIRRRIG